MPLIVIKPRARFFAAVEGNRIVGSYALLRSELNSRQDLSPWFACLYVNPDARGRKIGELLQHHAIQETWEKGYSSLYLCTDLIGYYERNQWVYIGKGYSLNDDETRIYAYHMDKHLGKSETERTR
ncbi:GNAT family N-acetyltransferase [Paenibacillus sacheonensis]|uniref:GNAT family N-acetyltransferase n=1 Tax=Paenibacillus sacheonensis TaxID=742054 RepID=A0A7X4YU00_9BACL|nr:GNAT family N-acetyltransferase [Paenibacillus sacheonensis]MBM7568827.1 putative N-acetyltransferase YhbS [Paenibacillus sacheonensis]NBC72532.1 GNAT family N-acetyltransferase [Paenibacillus sacheonensis]